MVLIANPDGSGVPFTTRRFPEEAAIVKPNVGVPPERAIEVVLWS